MKILELCLSPGFGGLELYVVKTSRWLVSHGRDVKIISRKGSLISQQLADENIACDHISSLSHHLPAIAAIRLARYLDKNEIDVMHIHWGKDLLLAVLGKVLSKRKPKLVYTRQMAITRSKHDRYHRFLYKHVDKYLTITRELADDARTFLPINPASIELLYYGVSAPGEQDQHACESLLGDCGFSKDDFNIGLFGRVEEGKGQQLLVEAVKSLLDQGKAVNAAVIGHVMDDKYYQQLISYIERHDLAGRIMHLGFLKNAACYMGCFDVVVLASRKETFGLVLIEAMRAGTPVIGTNNGGVPEIIEEGETGLLFEPDNSSELADKLRLLIDNPQLHNKIAHSGKEWADKMFAEDQHFKKLEKILAR